MKTKLFVLALAVVLALPLSAQTSSSDSPQNPNNTTSSPSSMDTTTPQSTTQNADDQNSPPAQYSYRVNVIQRSTQAVDYRDRGGSTQIDFKGTSLMPRVDGKAKVTGHTGRLAVDASFHHLQPARSFGPEYLTYVLWAITPEGRATNLGEVVPNGDGDVSVQVTSGLQEFGMIVTAEPYFAVTRPSDLVVAENIVRPDTEGGIHPITARYELLQKGQYTVNISPAQLPATEAEHQKYTPLQILEAENAIAIAEASGAAKYAPEPLQKAKDYLNQALDYQRRKQGRTPIGTVARAAAESAEDARLITLEKKNQELVTAQREREQERIRRAQNQAEREAARADEARLEARRQADERALAEQERLSAERARAQAEQARLEAEQAAQQAAQEKAQADQQLQAAQAARASAEQQQQISAQQAEQARLQAQQAEQARLQSEQQAEQQRQRLLQQLNQVLQTKDTAKGLIVNVSDVLFDTGKSTLKPGAKVRLAKVAGIILAYPDLRLEVDGYTDSTGTVEFNQRLSERRADAVRDFLVSQGVSSNNVGARGFGQADPIASNNTSAGRQLNRRVELVVSGTAIGQNIGKSNPGAAPAIGAGGVAGATGAAGATVTTPAQPSTTPSSVGAPVSTPAATPPSTTTTPAGTATPPPGSNTTPSTTAPAQPPK
ncbi:MAG TPA: OmpA family protein [Candidatus Angelobacter sp.]